MTCLLGTFQLYERWANEWMWPMSNYLLLLVNNRKMNNTIRHLKKNYFLYSSHHFQYLWSTHFTESNALLKYKSVVSQWNFTLRKCSSMITKIGYRMFWAERNVWKEIWRSTLVFFQISFFFNLGLSEQLWMKNLIFLLLLHFKELNHDLKYPGKISSSTEGKKMKNTWNK